MASELKVDKITGVATAGSISVTGEGNSTTTNLQQGLAKSWTYITGEGTPAVTDSFNTASLTDEATGQVRSNFTNSMNNDDFCFQVSIQENAFFAAVQELTTTSGRIRTSSSAISLSHNFSADSDVDGRNHLVLGDLA